MSTGTYAESDFRKILRHQAKIVALAKSNEDIHPPERSLLCSSAEAVTWGAEKLTAIIQNLSIADQEVLYEAARQMIQGSEFIGAIAITSESIRKTIEKQRRTKQGHKMHDGKTRKYKDRLELIESALRSEAAIHRKALSQSVDFARLVGDGVRRRYHAALTCDHELRSAIQERYALASYPSDGTIRNAIKRLKKAKTVRVSRLKASS